MPTMKRNMLFIVGAGAILIGAVIVQNLAARPSTYYPTVLLATPLPKTVTASPVAATPVPALAPTYHAPVASVPVVTQAPAPTPAPTVDPRCYPHYSTVYIDDLIAGMKATGYTQAQINDATAQAYMVQGWQSVHCF